MYVYKRLGCGGEVLPMQISMPSNNFYKHAAGVVDSANERKPSIENLQESAVESSAFTDEKPKQPPNFPDGGLRAWLTVAGCFLISFTSYGTYIH